jgi:hypothetical protein
MCLVCFSLFFCRCPLVMLRRLYQWVCYSTTHPTLFLSHFVDCLLCFVLAGLHTCWHCVVWIRLSLTSVFVLILVTACVESCSFTIIGCLHCIIAAQSRNRPYTWYLLTQPYAISTIYHIWKLYCMLCKYVDFVISVHYCLYMNYNV